MPIFHTQGRAERVHAHAPAPAEDMSSGATNPAGPPPRDMPNLHAQGGAALVKKVVVKVRIGE